MKYIKFNKTICGVDFLLNIIQIDEKYEDTLSGQLQSTDFFQIVFLKKAQGHLLLNNKKLKLRDNSIIFISQNQKHQWFIEKSQIEAHILVFQEDFLNEFFSDKYFTYRLLYFYQTEWPLSFNVYDQEIDAYFAKLTEIKQELAKPQNDSVHLIRSILYYILIQLNRDYAKKNNIETNISLDNIAYQFRKLVETHIYTKHRIEEYLELMEVSRVTLNKKVKQQFNVTATDFIKSRLLFEIKMKLIYSTNTIAEIANEFHFSEPQHLTRLFKKKEGITPHDFRTDYQNGN
ncbi:helix-turn-helix domain-containing protein [Flexithrix dorotheae]|uniref:helix-turn-helix domain-containing protein n=1 Tax=Flexithrix dorotheae TaxID=70993 RepID=UPI000360F5AF|nr:AraC family transcriptional regulator [Flexithrix dorotheae]